MVSNALRWSRRFRYWRPLIIFLSLVLIGLLLFWALSRYSFSPTDYGLHTVAKLILLSVLVAAFGRGLLEYILRSDLSKMEPVPRRAPVLWRPVFLLDINAPLYLAVGVLANVPAAVITALITQTSLQLYTAFRGLISWTEASYRVAATALLVLIAGKLYKFIAGSSHSVQHGLIVRLHEARELLGATFSAGFMLILIIILFTPILLYLNRNKRYASWRTYLFAPVLFQGLLLSMGPLLPIMDVFGTGLVELTWLLFLGPLVAIYYLAVTNTRMNVKTYELRRTLHELRSTRQRRDELHDYASLITQAQEDERRRLARDLHDDTAQALIALSLGLDGLESSIKKLNPPQKDVQWFADLHKLADDTLEGVRRACQDLRPSVLDNLGLHAALEWLSDISASRGVPCTFTWVGEAHTTAPETEIAIFRIVQEALSNVWKHSSASLARIELYYQANLLCIVVRDNGKGFPAISAQAPLGGTTTRLGLTGMRERARLIGATLTLDTFPGKGTTISLFLPL
ncbi:sensor histidine kinase [Ktedonosporobacter rubrisoli]|uniref:histidine kinase n=1 Tax=Ktedonosporobacter rubrisoli TaxID=2509675 RepID=A0A4P6K0C0_KTERU|nr:sensor histidine kinase [Ktedonosporobacter rubrisoli]QBD81395.1 sensor histidine kinase [Ktedonosporobacter rubrisoli]